MLCDVIFCLVVAALHECDSTVLGKIEGVESEEFLDEGDSLSWFLPEDDGIELFAGVAAYLEQGADVVVVAEFLLCGVNLGSVVGDTDEHGVLLVFVCFLFLFGHFDLVEAFAPHAAGIGHADESVWVDAFNHALYHELFAPAYYADDDFAVGACEPSLSVEYGDAVVCLDDGVGYGFRVAREYHELYGLVASAHPVVDGGGADEEHDEAVDDAVPVVEDEVA